MTGLSFVFAVLWFGWAPLVGAPPVFQEAISADPARQLEDKGFDHFYSLEYDQAITTFQKLRDSDPNNANFQNDVASAYLYKQLHVAGVLQGDMFTASNKFFRTKKIQVDRALEKAFFDANGAAIRICQAQLRRNKKDQDALYACGIAFATLATYQGLIERAKLETLSTARKASIYHFELIRLNPRWYDAYLIPGIYEYVLGSLPGSVKVLLLFGGFSGEKERGLRDVEIAAEQGNRAKQDAKILLAVMCRREKRYDDARRTLADLARSFPRNYIFPLEIASVSRAAGDEKTAVREYEQVLDDIRRGKPGFSEAPMARIHFELGALYWKTGDFESAKTHLEQVPRSRGCTSDLEKEAMDMLRQIQDGIHQQPG